MKKEESPGWHPSFPSPGSILYLEGPDALASAHKLCSPYRPEISHMVYRVVVQKIWGSCILGTRSKSRIGAGAQVYINWLALHALPDTSPSKAF